MLNKRILVLMFLLLLLPLVGCLTPPNQTPIITSSPITTATVGALYAYNINATDPDDDALTYSLITKPSGMIINSASGLIKWTPVATQVGDNSVIVKVSDGSLSIGQRFTIKVSKPTPTPINHAPVVTSTPSLTATVGIKYTYTIIAIDPDGDAITYSLASGPTGMTFDGIATISWKPVLGQVGNNGVTMKASDGKLNTPQSFTITVSALPPVNQPPVIYSIPNLMAIVGVAFTYEVEAFDPDGDTLTYSLADRPKGMEIESDTGKITWTPTSIQTGYNAVIVSVSDGDLSVTKYFGITVDPVTLIGIEVDPETMDLFEGGFGAIISVTAHYNNASKDDMVDFTDCDFDSDNDMVAKVNFDGLVKAESIGEATITVTYAPDWRIFRDTVKVTVKAVELDYIVVVPKTMSIFVGESDSITSVTAYYNDGTNNLPSNWTYDLNPVGIVDVNGVTGEVTAEAVGTTTITVNYTEGDITKRDDIIVTVIDLVHNTDSDEYFDTIQGALNDDDTLPGHTIEVSAGTYNGFVVTKNSITIRATGEAIITLVDQGGYDLDTGVMIDAVDVEIEGLTIDGGSREKSRGISGVTDAEYTVRDTTFTNLGTGIYANATYPAIKAELTAIGNTFTNCVAGIGGTDYTTLNAIEGNTFTDCGEGIGLGGGVQTTMAPDDSELLIAYLLDNNDFVNCTYDVRDWRN